MTTKRTTKAEVILEAEETKRLAAIDAGRREAIESIRSLVEEMARHVESTLQTTSAATRERAAAVEQLHALIAALRDRLNKVAPASDSSDPA